MDREQKRRALRQKIRAQRNNRTGAAPSAPSPASILNDPTTTLLSMGVDDKDALLHAKQLVATAKSIAHGSGGAHKIHAASARHPSSRTITEEASDAAVDHVEAASEDEEEAPPPAPDASDASDAPRTSASPSSK